MTNEVNERFRFVANASWPFSSRQYGSDVRIDTPTSSGHSYPKDLAAFVEIPKRRLFLRASFAEFGVDDFDPSKFYGPRFALVNKLADGIHLVLPIWLGKPPFELGHASDLEVAQVVAYCRAQGGYNKAHFDEWLAQRGFA